MVRAERRLQHVRRRDAEPRAERVGGLLGELQQQLLVGLALVPFRRLPKSAQAIAYDRREPLLYSGIVIYLTTGVSLAIALLMS